MGKPPTNNKLARIFKKKGKNDPKKWEVRGVVRTSKKKERVVDPAGMKELQERIERLQKKDETTRVLKKKLVSGELRRCVRTIKKMQKLKSKQEGTYVAEKYNTIDSMRITDATIEAHKQQDLEEELIHGETNDELKNYFTLDKDPKIMITTEYNCGKRSEEFAKDLENIFGGVMKYERRFERNQTARELALSLIPEGYTSLIIVNERTNQPYSMMIIALPYGPTAYFRITNLFTRSDLIGSVTPALDCPPEVIMTNFKTRLGRRLGRLLQQTLSKKEMLQARQVVTFHNQRDFIFFRAYRYIFDEQNQKVTAQMSEIGPQFTLKLRWLQVGIYNPEYEEFEFVQDPHEESTNRKLFYL